MAPTVKLHDSLGTNTQGFQFLPDDTLRYASAQVFHKQIHTMIWQWKSVKSWTPTHVEGTQSADCGYEPINSLWYNPSALDLGKEATGARHLQPYQKGTLVVDTWNENWGFVGSLSSGNNSVRGLRGYKWSTWEKNVTFLVALNMLFRKCLCFL